MTISIVFFSVVMPGIRAGGLKWKYTKNRKEIKKKVRSK
jgi:hypothetical protein